MAERRGSIAFFTTYRPPVPLDIYCSPLNARDESDEVRMTDGKSYNYNGHEIPPGALKTILKYTRLGKLANVDEDEVDYGNVSGIIFVSEGTSNLETLHIALRFHQNDGNDDDDDYDDEYSDEDEDEYSDDEDEDEYSDDEDEDEDEDDDDDDEDEDVEVYNFAKLYRRTFKGVRMEDSPCFAGDRYLIYVSTMEPNEEFRQPWTAVYRTDLRNGKTVRLTPPGVADFSPSTSPSGRKIAVATLQYKEGGWTGEIENLKTDIVLMDVKQPFNRTLVIKNGGWPSWGSNNILYFHRARQTRGPNENIINKWSVFRAKIHNGISQSEIRMTPEDVDAMTPAAIDENRVAVAIIRQRVELNMRRKSSRNYRHIEVFDRSKRYHPLPISQRIQKKADHHNPFVIKNDCQRQGKLLIGYNACSEEELERGDISEDFDKLMSEDPEVGVLRVPGVFPTFTQDGRKLAFVDNDFQNVYLADKHDVRIIFSVTDLELDEDISVFSPVWNPKRDILYVCVGPAFKPDRQVDIYAIFDVSSDGIWWKKLTTTIDSNNAFPSTNPEGTKLVYRSTRDWVGDEFRSSTRPKNLYIMEDVQVGETRRRNSIRRLTYGDWIDTHCHWSPNGDWIVFSSTQDKPYDAPRSDHGLDPGYYAIYLLKANDPAVVVKVITGSTIGAGHVNHPMFSPDGRSIVFSSDHAGVSVEPISLPLFLHSVRPYGDIFTVNIDRYNIYDNEDLANLSRVTHSRYENSTPNWSKFSTEKIRGAWKERFAQCLKATWSCPFQASSSGAW